MSDIRENMPETKPTLVLGGTGKTGRRVVERLKARGMPVRVGSRSGQPPFDWEDQTTWAPALDGVGRSISPTTRTWRSQARWRRSARSPGWLWRMG